MLNFKKIKLYLSTDKDVLQYKENNDFFYYTSTDRYNNFKRVVRLLFVFLSLSLIFRVFWCIKYFPVIENILDVIISVCVSFVCSAYFLDFFDVYIINVNNRSKFDIVVKMINLSIESSEVKFYCKKKKCSFINIGSCRQELDGCGEMECSMQECKIYKKYEQIRYSIFDCYNVIMYHFPELIKFIDAAYKYSRPDLNGMIDIYKFFDLVIRIPFDFIEEYKKDKKLVNNIKNELRKIENDFYSRKNIGYTDSFEFQYKNLLNITGEVDMDEIKKEIFKPFEELKY